jgi:3-oxoacyl-[acyl-carrier protein] reductase
LNARPLEQRHALVCGASRGIGRATAKALAQRGARVTCLARNQTALNELVSEIEADGGHAQALVADLDNTEQLGALVDALVGEVGSVHIVIHNTGGPPSGALTQATSEDLTTAYRRHVLSAQAIMQRTLPGMVAAEYGRFIQVLSTSVREPIPNLGVSNLTRAAMASWAKTLSREFPAGVTINNILPGFTDTDRLTELKQSVASKRGVSPDDVHAGWLAQVPEGRLAQPEETAAAIAFLVSPEAAYIRGVSLAVDGGRLRSI